MKLFTFLLAFFVLIVSCSADIAAESASDADPKPGKCKTWKDCKNLKLCVNGYCRWPLASGRGFSPLPPLFGRDETISTAEVDARELQRDRCDAQTPCSHGQRCVRTWCRRPRLDNRSVDLEDSKDADDAETAEVEAAQCRSNKDCRNYKHCIQGTCQYMRGQPPPALLADDQSGDDESLELESTGMDCNSPEQCTGDKSCIHGNCRYIRGRSSLTGQHSGDVADQSDPDGSCQKDADCRDGVCIEKVCVKADVNDNLESNVDAPGILSERDSLRACKCPKDKMCNYQGKCVDKKCGDHSGCKIGYCKNGKCTNGLTGRSDDSESDPDDAEDAKDTDLELDVPETNLFARGKKCKTFKNCAMGEKCEHGRCRKWSCSERPDCRSGCKNGKCLRSLGRRTGDLRARSEVGGFEDAISCTSSGDCAGGVCLDGICFSDTGIQERDTDAFSRCQTDQDCPHRHICSDNTCKSRHAAEKRDDGATADIKPDDEDTTVSKPEVELLAGKYPPRCQSNNDCPRWNRCYGGICKYRPPHAARDDKEISLDDSVDVLGGKYPPHCKSNNDCPPSQRCYGSFCKNRHPQNHSPAKRQNEDTSDSDGDDFTITKRTPFDILPTNVGGDCTSDSACPRGQRCLGGICKSRGPAPPANCRAHSDCRHLQRCREGICQYPGTRPLGKRDDEDIPDHDDEDDYTF